jgi:hypothetical protein
VRAPKSTRWDTTARHASSIFQNINLSPRTERQQRKLIHPPLARSHLCSIHRQDSRFVPRPLWSNSPTGVGGKRKPASKKLVRLKSNIRHRPRLRLRRPTVCEALANAERGRPKGLGVAQRRIQVHFHHMPVHVGLVTQAGTKRDCFSIRA